ncbi:hypothetical protein PSHT_15070 [Puccinia striiformis]|uniref:Uncharacterized protein n=1 Tax=Puccinia striiformis TaxID=27350 RepID=A0A2S4UGZ7_9BASI|nr:hypothetical protein PSHT_15070 [Puccinia striiformis]
MNDEIHLLDHWWTGKGSGPTVEDYYAMAEREGRSSGPQTYSQTSSSSSHQPTYRSGWNFERLFHHQQQPTPSSLALNSAQAQSRISMVYRHLNRT